MTEMTLSPAVVTRNITVQNTEIYMFSLNPRIMNRPTLRKNEVYGIPNCLQSCQQEVAEPGLKTRPVRLKNNLHHYCLITNKPTFSWVPVGYQAPSRNIPFKMTDTARKGIGTRSLESLVPLPVLNSACSMEGWHLGTETLPRGRELLSTCHRMSRGEPYSATRSRR